MNDVIDHFRLTGRLSRHRYLGRLSEVLLLGAFLYVGAIVAVIKEATPLALALGTMLAVIAWFGIAATVRRLHDRGMSGIWCAVMLCVQALSMGFHLVSPDAGRDLLPAQLLFSVVTVFVLSQVLIFGGSSGANRYGPAPDEAPDAPARSALEEFGGRRALRALPERERATDG